MTLDDNRAKLNEAHEAFVVYNGAYDPSDDPADYLDLTALKGVRVA